MAKSILYKASAVTLNDKETMNLINAFAAKERRSPANAARELIYRGSTVTLEARRGPSGEQGKIE